MQIGFFEVSDAYSRLDSAGDPLAKLDSFVCWEGLLPLIEPLRFESGVRGGRPGHDPLMMVKCLLLQSLYNISDDSCEYQINDRLSFKRFLWLSPSQKAPDAKTIWLYRERIKHGGLHERIFAWFSEELERAGYAAKGGQIVDAAFVPTHRPTGGHKKQLREEIPLTEAQARQIDPDATFVKKGEATFHGYKNHVKIDAKHKFIRKDATTTASVHDSREFDGLVDAAPCGTEGGAEVWADSAYRSAESEAMLAAKGLASRVCERAYRNKPLTDAQKAGNTEKSRVRARVEHVFGHVGTAMGGFMIHTVGLARARVKIAFKNLAYNMQRFAFLQAKAA